MNSSHIIPIARLCGAFEGRRCVSAWLGYGDVLYLGLGHDLITGRNSEGRHSQAAL